MASLQTMFNQYYAQQLKPFGFQKLKGMPAFGRIVNGEVLHIIKLVNRYPMIREKKCFNVTVGAWSVYSFHYGSIDRHTFDNYSQVLACLVPEEKLELSQEDSLSWGLHYDEGNMQDKLILSFDMVREYALPFLDGIQTLQDYIQYCKRWRPIALKDADRFYFDSPLLILTDNHEDFMDSYQRMCDILLHQSYGDDPNHPEYIENKERMYQYYIVETAQARDKVYADPALYARCMEELDTRKQQSAELLRSAGLKL